MRDSLMRDRVADEESIDGSVDKSVVNWLMHVISGKDPIGLGINDASVEAAETAEPGPQVVASRKDAQEPAAAPSPELTITAEDLCGAPVFPVIGAIKLAKDEVTADDLCFVPEEDASEPFRRMTGLQLVELSNSTEMAAAAAIEPAVADVFREGVYYGPPPSEATTAIAESLRPRKQQAAEAKTEEIDPVEIARDPEYIEEKMRAGKVTVDEVDWIPSAPEAAAVEMVADPFAAVEEKPAEPEVKAAEPVAVVAEPEVVEATEPVAVVAEPEVVEAAPESEVVEAAPEVAAVETVIDPFAGVDEMPAEPEVKAAEPVAVVAEPEVVEAAEPEVVEAAEPVAVVAEPEIAEPVVAEPEAAAAEIVAEPEVAAPVESKVEAVAESTAVAEPEVEDEALAEPAIAEEEVPAVPEMMAEAEASVTAEAVATQEPEAEVEPAVSQPVAANGFTDHMWTTAVAQRDPNEKKFSAEDYYQEQMQKSQPAKVERVPEKVPEKAAEPSKETAGQPENLTAALKTLMQLGSVLPLAARMAPMFEGNGSGEPAPGSSQEVRQEVSGLRLLQYEIKTTVQDHSSQLKRLEEQLTQIRESVELDSSENAAVMENVKSTVKLVRVMGIGLGVMLMVLILMIGMMLVHGK